MERRTSNISENIDSDQKEPFVYEALEGIVDEGLKDILEMAISMFRYRDEGIVIEQDTIFAVMPVIYRSEGEYDKSPKIISAFNRKIYTLQRTGLYHRYIVPNPEVKKAPRYVVTVDSMVNAISFLYTKEREDKKRRQPATGFEIMFKTAEAFGENPRGLSFFEAGVQLEVQYEKSMVRGPKKVTGTINGKDLDNVDPKYHFVWDKNFIDKTQITLHDKLSCLNIETITQILGKVNYASEIDSFSVPRRQRNYQDFGLDREVGQVIEHIRKLDSKKTDNKQEISEFDLKRFENGLWIVRGYLQKYPNILNCDVLLMAIERTLSQGERK